MPPNFRIHDGMMQIAFPTKVSLLGVDQSIVMLAEGGFSRQDGRVIFVPSSVSLGSCRLDRLPFIKMFLFQQVLALQTVPEDIATSWAKLASARVEGSELTLSMP